MFPRSDFYKNVAMQLHKDQRLPKGQTSGVLACLFLRYGALKTVVFFLSFRYFKTLLAHSYRQNISNLCEMEMKLIQFNTTKYIK